MCHLVQNYLRSCYGEASIHQTIKRICKRVTLQGERKILVPAQNTSEIAKYFEVRQSPMQK